MKIAWIRLVGFAILAHAAVWAQPPSSGTSPALAYENGSIVNNVYTNECFGFSFAIPEGWQVNTQFAGANGKARHTSKGSLALLLIHQQKEGPFGNTIALLATDPSSSPPTVQEFVSRIAHGQVGLDGGHREILKDTFSVNSGGKQFFRADYKQTMKQGTLYNAFVFTKFRGYYIGESVTAESPEELEQSANSLQHISFQEDKPNPQCVMAGDDKPNLGGVLGGVLSSNPVTPQSGSGPPQRVRVSQGVSTGLLVNKVPPQYPDVAKQARIQGQVVLQAEIDKHGDVESLTLISGHPMLAPAAIEAVKQWKYKPYLLNGQPVAVETQIIVNFQLSDH